VLGRKEDAHRPRGRYIRPLEIEDVVMTIRASARPGPPARPMGRWSRRSSWPFPATEPCPKAGLRAALAERLPASHQPDLIVIADALPHSQDIREAGAS